jgi:hypothetical protein
VGTPILLDALKTNFNVFRIEIAQGSEYIPAQQTFVERYGIRSGVGMEGCFRVGSISPLSYSREFPFRVMLQSYSGRLR